MNHKARYHQLFSIGLCCLLVACSSANNQESVSLVEVTADCPGANRSSDSAEQPCANLSAFQINDSELAAGITQIFNDARADGRTILSLTVSKDDATPIVLTGPGQVLPITAQAIIADKTFDLEVAQTSRQQQLGLMFREALPDHRGMLFPFSSPRPARFWMKNVPVGLDMVFLFEGKVQGIVEAPPCESDPCPTYGPGNLLVDNVIELRIGRAAELGLQAGDQVEIRYLEE